MPTWLTIALVVVGVFVLIEIGLVLAGKKELAKKLVVPFTLIAGALFASQALGRKDQDIRDEKDRIDDALGDVEAKADDLRGQVQQRTDEHEQNVGELEDQVAQSDARAGSLEEEIKTLQEGGTEGFVDGLSEEEHQRIRDENKLNRSSKFRGGN